MSDEKDLLRSFRVPGAPPDPEALARGRQALGRHIAASGHPAGRRHPRRLAWATAAATVAVLAVVNAVALLGVGTPDDDAPDGTGPSPRDAAAAPVRADRPVCPDVPAPSTGGRDIWVSVDGDDSRSGATAAEALADPQEAVGRARPGDRVLLATGVYTSDRSTVVEIDADGAPGREIVLTAAPGARPVIRTGARNWNAVLVTGSYVVVSGLTVEGHKGATDVATATAMVDDNDPRTAGNGIVVQAAQDGARFPHHVVVRHNTVRDMPGGGISARRTGSVTIECNEVLGNANLSPFGNSGVSVADSHSVGPDTAEVVVRRNVVHDNDSLVPRRGSGPEPSRRSVQSGHGIACDGEDEAVWRGRLLVEDNLVYDNGGSGVNIQNCDRVRVAGNTSAGNGTRSGPAGEVASEVTVRRSADVELVDNLLVFRPGGSALAQPAPVPLAGNVATADTGVFVDAGAGNYRPRCDGPAADAGAVEAC